MRSSPRIQFGESAVFASSLLPFLFVSLPLTAALRRIPRWQLGGLVTNNNLRASECRPFFTICRFLCGRLVAQRKGRWELTSRLVACVTAGQVSHGRDGHTVVILSAVTGPKIRGTEAFLSRRRPPQETAKCRLE